MSEADGSTVGESKHSAYPPCHVAKSNKHEIASRQSGSIEHAATSSLHAISTQVGIM